MESLCATPLSFHLNISANKAVLTGDQAGKLVVRDNPNE
jgi:hypothetical protein